jgi:hypothetical protein
MLVLLVDVWLRRHDLHVSDLPDFTAGSTSTQPAARPAQSATRTAAISAARLAARVTTRRRTWTGPPSTTRSAADAGSGAAARARPTASRLSGTAGATAST